MTGVAGRLELFVFSFGIATDVDTLRISSSGRQLFRVRAAPWPPLPKGQQPGETQQVRITAECVNYLTGFTCLETEVGLARKGKLFPPQSLALLPSSLVYFVYIPS